jgi:hypothetical protein
MALLPGRPRIDAGNPSDGTDGKGHLLKSDQRGMPRPDTEGSSGCDMGAYERQSGARFHSWLARNNSAFRGNVVQTVDCDCANLPGPDQIVLGTCARHEAVSTLSPAGMRFGRGDGAHLDAVCLDSLLAINSAARAATAASVLSK